MWLCGCGNSSRTCASAAEGHLFVQADNHDSLLNEL